VAASVAVPLAGAARPTAVPAPAALGPLTAGGEAELTHRYAADRADIVAAEHQAAQYGDQQRAATLLELTGRLGRRPRPSGRGWSIPRAEPRSGGVHCACAGHGMALKMSQVPCSVRRT